MSNRLLREADIAKAWASHEPERLRISPEAKRTLRNYKRVLAPIADRLELAFERNERLFSDFCYKGHTGRARALAKIKSSFAGAKVRHADKRIAISWLAPVDCIYDNPTPSMNQGGILLMLLCVGGDTRSDFSCNKTMAVEVSDHSLHRLIDRGGSSLDVGAAICQAADHWLSADIRQFNFNDSTTLYLPAGPGLLVGKSIKFIDRGVGGIHFRADTFVSKELARPDQVPMRKTDDIHYSIISLEMTLLRMSSMRKGEER